MLGQKRHGALCVASDGSGLAGAHQADGSYLYCRYQDRCLCGTCEFADELASRRSSAALARNEAQAASLRAIA